MVKNQKQKNTLKNKKDAEIFFNQWRDEEIENCKTFTRFYVQGSMLKDIEPELKDIFSFKLNALLTNYLILKINCWRYYGNDPFFDVNLYDMAKQIADDQMKIFCNEIKRENIKKILTEAKKGNKKSIYELVYWEKTAIALKFVAEAIEDATLIGDKDFFKQLAEVIKKNRRTTTNQIFYVRMLNYLVPFLKLQKGLSERKIFKELNTKKRGVTISDMMREKLSKDDNIPSLDDPDYFIKFLKRNKIVP